MPSPLLLSLLICVHLLRSSSLLACFCVGMRRLLSCALESALLEGVCQSMRRLLSALESAPAIFEGLGDITFAEV